MKKTGIILIALFSMQTWAGATIEFKGKVRGLSGGVVTIEDKYQTTGIKVAALSTRDQKSVKKELAANGEVTVHVPPKAVVKQTKLKK